MHLKFRRYGHTTPPNTPLGALGGGPKNFLKKLRFGLVPIWFFSSFFQASCSNGSREKDSDLVVWDTLYIWKSKICVSNTQLFWILMYAFCFHLSTPFLNSMSKSIFVFVSNKRFTLILFVLIYQCYSERTEHL